MSASDSSARREEEAALWFAVMRRGVMTLDERENLDNWRRHAGNRALLRRFEKSWESLEACESHVTRMVPAIRSGARHYRARSALLAAMCVVSLGIGVLSLDGHSGFWTTLDWTDR